MPELDISAMRKVCVMQTAYLGDVVLTTPLFTALRRHLPDSTLHVVTTRAAAPLLSAHPSVDEIIVYDKRGAHSGFSGMCDLAKRLRNEEYDLVLCPHPSFRSGLILKMAKIPCRIGFRDSTGRFFHTHTIHRDKTLHEVQRVLSLLKVLGIKNDENNLRPHLTPDPKVEQSYREKCRFLGLDPRRPIAAVNPFSVWETKRWLPKGFAEVIDELAWMDFQVLLLGGPVDKQGTAQVLDECKTKPANAVGLFDLRELIWALSDCRIYVTCDSGPMHIAAALETDVVSIFGSTVPAQGYAPYTERAQVIQVDLDCRPCGPHGHKRCPKKHFRCMKDINSEDVMEGVRMLLGQVA